eukprot:2329414-Rhodomonas_salina.1
MLVRQGPETRCYLTHAAAKAVSDLTTALSATGTEAPRVVGEPCAVLTTRAPTPGARSSARLGALAPAGEGEA